jgi:hypothetical protein
MPNYSFPFMPYEGGQQGGYRLDYCTILPPGNSVHYVRSTGAASGDPPELSGRVLTTINEALAQCRTGMGDVVYVLPGHAETYANDGDFWSNLVAGTKIIGMGWGSLRPTITFTHANAQADIDVANVYVSGFKFTITGTTTVANPFNVTASDFHFINNEVMAGSAVGTKVTDFIKLAAGGDGAVFANNYCYSTTDAAITSLITTTGAVDQLKIVGNHIAVGVVTAATGVVMQLSNAAISNNIIVDNLIWNNTASSKYVISPHADSTGWVDNNRWGTGDGGTAPASSAFVTYTTKYRFGINQCITADAVSALLSPAVDA